MKSQLNYMLETWDALLYDVASSCAISASEVVRDSERLRTRVKHRGLGSLTLDLPHLDTLLLSLLENSSVRFEGPLSVRRSKRDVRPRFLNAFWSLICDSNGCLLNEPDVDAIIAIRQLSCFFKKLQVSCSPKRVDDAVKEYYEIESTLQRSVLDWSLDDLPDDTACSFSGSFRVLGRVDLFGSSGGTSLKDVQFLRRLDKVSGVLLSELGYFDSMSEDSTETGFFKHGKGAVSNIKSKDYKYSFPYWSNKLEGFFPYDWCSGDTLGSYAKSQKESPSALLSVPKTAKAPRLIASEPVEHQWCQQKIATWLTYRVNNTLIGRFVAIQDQTLSQRMVAQASIDRSLSTLDLSSASDRVTCRHIEALCRSNPQLLRAFHAVRTRVLEDRTTKRDNLKLQKFATMGSALTFPVQCIFFLCVALASAGAHDRKSIIKLIGSVRVFGDDIIIPTHAYDDCVYYLTFLGLKVNKAKSFSLGYFRESCGMDAWRGFDVTPVKPKHLVAGAALVTQSLIDTSNNLFKKGFWRAAEKIAALIPHRFKRNVFSVADEAASGLVSYCGDKFGSLKWDRYLHRWYAPQPIYVDRAERVVQNNSFALREFFTRPFCAERPRETGTKRRGVAVIATRRVEAKTSEVILFS